MRRASGIPIVVASLSSLPASARAGSSATFASGDRRRRGCTKERAYVSPRNSQAWDGFMVGGWRTAPKPGPRRSGRSTSAAVCSRRSWRSRLDGPGAQRIPHGVRAWCARDAGNRVLRMGRAPVGRAGDCTVDGRARRRVMELPRDCGDSTRVSIPDRGRRGHRLLDPRFCPNERVPPFVSAMAVA
jgi:hypothetical protein